MADVPKLDDVRAAILHGMSADLHVWNRAHGFFAELGLCVGGVVTPLGRAALAAYDAKKRAEVASEAMRTHFRIHSFDEWREDYGAVLWFTLPIEEPPWCGTPNDEDWPWVLVAREDTCWCLLPSIMCARKDDARVSENIAEIQDRIAKEESNG